ncbi:lipocalin-like domain-containing protein [Methylomagnum ishizawai]|uniref:lipocalin-like domain-containing protein n=1 Tax=Methylomagnum ishizawai TaxID=1760988 RepID=UPI001C32CBAA|nr:lipocalin-like domain-containing protein [Methylomagnum ishizawai]BBL77279.1 hypothetical protein MishRS11D_43770 [Methylomagnum ishizawai]
MEDIAQRIVGTWRPVHSLRINAEGNREYPYGEDALGYIHYADVGIMAVRISRKSRSGARGLEQLRRDYLAYFGRYEIDAGRQGVRHFVEGRLFPGDPLAILERRYRFEGDLLWLTPVDGTHREILWRRLYVPARDG